VNAADVPLASLRLGERLGSGGQGEVFRLLNRPGEVLKRYFALNANAATLDALVAFPRGLPEIEREALSRQTAWPLARVTKHGATVGFLMKEVPGAFVGRTEAGPRLRELQFLLFPRSPLWGDIAPPGTSGRLELAHAFAALMRIFHDHGMVVGDVSLANLLWSPGFPARIYLIDCDSPTPAGRDSVLPQTDTPDWHDPLRPHTGPDVDTDRYKLALVIGRTLCADAYVRPGRPLKLPADLPDAVAAAVAACFAEAGGPHGTRPTAARWLQALRGRGEIRFGQPPVLRPSPPTLPMTPVQGRGPDRPRPTITFKPSGGKAP
jgi:DNA-binding helix-hairpin-helix protein with protein kinase domain